MNKLELSAVPGIPEIAAGDDLARIIFAAASAAGITCIDDDIFIVAQKAVSKAEGRTVKLRDVQPSAEAERLAALADKDPRVVELILAESNSVVRCVRGVIIVEHRLGFVMANAGIDASNVAAPGGDESVLLLPENPDNSADRLRTKLSLAWGVRIGVVINDSFGRAWRLGTTGTAIGVAGLPALVDLRGRPDRNGRILVATEIGVADELAAGASLLMGQAAEGQPVVHARGFPYAASSGTAKDLVRASKMDLFR